MLAFHGDPAIKVKYLNRVQAHAAADEIIHGKYWERGKGCAIGCTIHGSSHSAYETELGIPVMLARLEDRLFEGMANGDSKAFPGRFLQAITPGADLSRVSWQFLYWLLTEELVGRDDLRVADEIRACAEAIAPLTRGEPVDQQALESARRNVLAARNRLCTAAAAAYAAYAAAAAADVAADAAVADAADAAAFYAADAAAFYAAAARSGCYHRMADKLLELLASAPLAGFFARAA